MSKAMTSSSNINSTSTNTSLSPSVDSDSASSLSILDIPSDFDVFQEDPFSWMFLSNANSGSQEPLSSSINLSNEFSKDEDESQLQSSHVSTKYLSNSPLNINSEDISTLKEDISSEDKHVHTSKRLKTSDPSHQQKLIQNREASRVSRKRRMEKLAENEKRLKQLEAVNLDLRMRLKIGKEALRAERQEKDQIKDRMKEMLSSGASAAELESFVNNYKQTYAEYGPSRRRTIQYHLEQIRQLIVPTQVTKMCLYSVEQGDEIVQTDSMESNETNANSTASETTKCTPKSSFSVKGNQNFSMEENLWALLAHELDVTEQQQQQILERREQIKKQREDLRQALRTVDQLHKVTEKKNLGLERQIAELQSILTPQQAAKFILWIKENPAFMYMLDRLVDRTLNNRNPTKEEEKTIV